MAENPTVFDSLSRHKTTLCSMQLTKSLHALTCMFPESSFHLLNCSQNVTNAFCVIVTVRWWMGNRSRAAAADTDWTWSEICLLRDSFQAETSTSQSCSRRAAWTAGATAETSTSPPSSPRSLTLSVCLLMCVYLESTSHQWVFKNCFFVLWFLLNVCLMWALPVWLGLRWPVEAAVLLHSLLSRSSLWILLRRTALRQVPKTQAQCAVYLISALKSDFHNLLISLFSVTEMNVKRLKHGISIWN